MAKKQNHNFYTASTQVRKIREINERYAITINDIADVLDVTSKTILRWKRRKDDSQVISKQKSDSLNILNSILKLGKKVLGSDDELNKWLHSSVFALEGKKPIELIKTESGRRKVENVLHQIEYGIY